MRILVLILLLFVLSSPGRAQTMPAPMAEPVQPGNYAYLFRDVFWNASTSQWRPDSLLAQGRQTWVQTPNGLRMQFEHLGGYNYQSHDTSYARYTYWGQTPYNGFTDTLNRIFRVIGSNPALREYRRENKRFFPGGSLYAVLDFVNGLDSTSIYYYDYDTQGRKIRDVLWGFGGLPVHRDSIPIIDSSFYQGASPYPYRERMYTSLRVQTASPVRVLAMSQQTDSIVYDAQGRRIYEASNSWSQVGVQSGHVNITTLYNGDTREIITKIYGFTSATPPQPRPLVARRDVFIQRPDSTKSYFYNWDNAAGAFRLDYRRIASFPHPGTSLLNFNDVRIVTDSLKNGVWKPYLGTENQIEFGPGGVATRLMIRSWRGANIVTSMERKDMVFYTPGLLPIHTQSMPTAFSIAPNPASTHLFIFADQPVSRLVLTNAVGQQFEVSLVGGRAYIGHLPKGLYQAAAYRQGESVGGGRLMKE